MTYEQKGLWVYLTVVLGSYAGYLAVVLGRSGPVPLADVSYAAPMLWSIGIAIVVSIAGRIVVEIARPSERLRPDVRDRDIKRSGEYLAGLVLAVAMAVPLALTLARVGHFWIANGIYAAYVVSTVVGAVTKLVAYRL